MKTLWHKLVSRHKRFKAEMAQELVSREWRRVGGHHFEGNLPVTKLHRRPIRCNNSNLRADSVQSLARHLRNGSSNVGLWVADVLPDGRLFSFSHFLRADAIP